MVDGESNRGTITARWAVGLAFGAAGVLLLAWGVIVLVSKGSLLQGWLVAVSLLAASVWLLSRSSAVLTHPTAAPPVRPS